MKNAYQKIVALLGSRLGFGVIWFIAIFQGAWMAVFSRYPMAFDEAYHYSLIKLHADQWNPLFLQQPDGPAPFGALVRDPSWLHHYLLSLPYRVLEATGASEFTKIVTLRLCNVLMFAAGLYLFRRLLLKTKASPAAVHASLFFFVMVPTVTLLSGQINYDNLQFPLVALALLATHRAAASLRARKPDTLALAGALGFSLLGTLNKFTFLPLLVAIVTYLLIVANRAYAGSLAKLRKDLRKSWAKVVAWQRRTCLAILAVLAGLFIWFYGVNTVVYQNPVIQCHQVLEPSRCEGFEPWLRNYKLAQTAERPSANPATFTLNWIGGMFYRTFFVINGATGLKRYTNHVPVGIAGAAIGLLVVGLPLAVRYGWRIIRRDTMLQLSLFASLIYIVSLWGRNYNDFLHLGEMVAINGRYFQPVLLPLILLMVASYQHAFRFMPGVKLAILGLAFTGFMSGGGIIGFIHYSDVNWYFEGRQWLVRLNDWAQKIILPLFLFRR